MCHFSQIMGGSFSRGLYSEVVAFSSRLAVQPFPLKKSNGEKQDGSLPFLYPAFLMARMALHLYSGPALWSHTFTLHEQRSSMDIITLILPENS